MEEIEDRSKKNVFISYLDDDGKKKDVWCKIIEENVSFVTFKFNQDIITVPFHRILKIKKKEVDNNEM